jgi:hypothetical protein
VTWLRFALDRPLRSPLIAHHYTAADFFLAWLDPSRSYTTL